MIKDYLIKDKDKKLQIMAHVFGADFESFQYINTLR